jgi:hypothetical protein
LVENATSNAVGQQYSYSLSESAHRSLDDFEATPAGRTQAAALDPILSKSQWLLQADLRDLEYAATIVFFRKQGHDWPVAIEKMCQFKGLTVGSPVVERADDLARKVIE